jgi:protein-S-isoprenylcysteine O-methyltransferase Ste14
LNYFLFTIFFLAPFYFVYTDRKSIDLFDSYWVLGKILTGRSHEIKKIPNKNKVIMQYVLSWLVKGFFIPAMYIEVVGFINMLYSTSFGIVFTQIGLFFSTMLMISFGIDYLIGLTGYLLTLKILDSHIRSTDATLWGWGICLVCYYPFYKYLDLILEKNTAWLQWIENPKLQIVWCLLALSFLAIYVFCTITFGIRFSNLTNRGILTNGPYRFTKHPAYLCKNIYWWCTVFPVVFITTDPMLRLQYFLMMCGISLIYYFRAKTEETHLRKDPTYVAYCEWIKQNGIFPKAKRLILR